MFNRVILFDLFLLFLTSDSFILDFDESLYKLLISISIFVF